MAEIFVTMINNIEPGTLYIASAHVDFVPIYYHIDLPGETNPRKRGMYAGQLEKENIVAFLGHDVATGTEMPIGVFLTHRGIFRIFLQDLQLITNV